jgi:hypothetical protein
MCSTTGADADGGPPEELAAIDQKLAFGDRVHRLNLHHARGGLTPA